MRIYEKFRFEAAILAGLAIPVPDAQTSRHRRNPVHVSKIYVKMKPGKYDIEPIDFMGHSV
jgi:hypothetical protein